MAQTRIPKAQLDTTLVDTTTSQTISANKTYSGTSTFSGGITIGGSSHIETPTTRTAAVTLTSNSVQYNPLNAATAAFTVTLPSTTTPGILFTFVKVDTTANIATIAGTISGMTNYQLIGQGQSLTVQSTATAGVWLIVATSAPRIIRRVFSTTSTATLTPEIDTYDVFTLTAQAAALTIANHSTSAPTDFEKIQIRILDNATARTITFGTNYVARYGLTLPTTTVASKYLVMGFEWNAALAKYVLIALRQES